VLVTMENVMERKVQTRSADTENAIDLLIADHKKVQKLFREFEKLKEADEAVGTKAKAMIVQQVCMELQIHAQIEEEIFYPRVRKAIDDDDLMDEAEVEHTGAKELIAQLESMEPSDDLYDAKFTVLGENVNHHIKEEQDEMFTKARKAKLDLDALGKQLKQRRQELQDELGIVPETQTEPRTSAEKSSHARKRSAA
jgi:hemerythrin superfamily protein